MIWPLAMVCHSSVYHYCLTVKGASLPSLPSRPDLSHNSMRTALRLLVRQRRQQIQQQIECSHDQRQRQ